MGNTHITIIYLLIIALNVVLGVFAYEIVRLYRLVAATAEIVARQAELLRKISETRWGIHD